MIQMSNLRQTLSPRADSLGIIASGLCFVHCVLTPIILSFSAVWAHYLPSDERFHRALAVIVAITGSTAISIGYRKHRRLRVVCFMVAGLTFILCGAWFGDRLPSHGAEIAVTTTGSLLMIAAHLMNHTFCRNCGRCAD
jgi:uncharacterized membrane protein YfcA